MIFAVCDSSMHRWHMAASQVWHHSVATTSTQFSHGLGRRRIFERDGIKSRRLKFGFGWCVVTAWQLEQRHKAAPVLLSVVLMPLVHARQTVWAQLST
jgi:hypothetical protein